MFDADALAKSLGEQVAAKLDEPIPDGVLQTVVAEALKLIGSALTGAGAALGGTENADGDA